jgi:hypothetical protein
MITGDDLFIALLFLKYLGIFPGEINSCTAPCMAVAVNRVERVRR